MAAHVLGEKSQKKHTMLAQVLMSIVSKFPNAKSNSYCVSNILIITDMRI